MFVDFVVFIILIITIIIREVNQQIFSPEYAKPIVIIFVTALRENKAVYAENMFD